MNILLCSNYNTIVLKLATLSIYHLTIYHDKYLYIKYALRIFHITYPSRAENEANFIRQDTFHQVYLYSNKKLCISNFHELC